MSNGIPTRPPAGSRPSQPELQQVVEASNQAGGAGGAVIPPQAF